MAWMETIWPMMTRLALWCTGRQQYWAKPRYIGYEFCFGRAVEHQCSFFPYLFFFFTSPWATGHDGCAPRYSWGSGERKQQWQGKQRHRKPARSLPLHEQLQVGCHAKFPEGWWSPFFPQTSQKTISGPVQEVHNYNVYIASPRSQG